MIKETGNSEEFLSLREMKEKPIFKEISVETGHPEHAINMINVVLEDEGFKISRDHSPEISDNELIGGVKNFLQNIEAMRTEREYREKAKEYKIFSLISLGISIILITFLFISLSFIIFVLLGGIITIIFSILSRPIVKKENIWIKVKGQVYSGTKSKELRETGKNKAGMMRSTATIYVHSELTFSIAGDSEKDIKRIREDISNLSKYIQKI